MPYAHLAVAARKHPLAGALLSALAMGCSLPLWALDAPAKLQVPTLAYDEQQIILVWEKPADHAEIVDYHVYANGKLLGGSNANNDQVSPAKPYIDHFYQQDTQNFHHRIALGTVLLHVKQCRDGRGSLHHHRAVGRLLAVAIDRTHGEAVFSIGRKPLGSEAVNGDAVMEVLRVLLVEVVDVRLGR